MNSNHLREQVLSVAAETHPRFAMLATEPAAPLLSLSAMVAEGFDDVDLRHLERQLDFLAFLVDRACASDAPRDRLAALQQVLATEEGFTGDPDGYDDPTNSYLGSVVERRTGLPITLSVVYLAIARRLDWPLVGIDFPLHFLVRYEQPGELLVVDPFDAGRVVGLERCMELAAGVMGSFPLPQQIELTRRHLDNIADDRRVVVRMLKNLESSFLRRKDYSAVKSVIEKLLLIDPAASTELRDLGGVYHLLGDHQRALSCLRGYLVDSPFAPDRHHVRAVMAWLRELIEGGGDPSGPPPPDAAM